MKGKLLVIISLLAVVGAVSFLTLLQRKGKLIGGEKDARGCLMAAGYSWCEAKQKCLRTWEESCQEVEGEGGPTPTIAISAESVLAKLAQTVGFSFGSSKAEVEWNIGDQKLVFDGLSYHYSENSDKVEEKRQAIDDFLREEKFVRKQAGDSQSQSVADYSAYKMGRVVCNLKIINLADKAKTELEIACADSN